MCAVVDIFRVQYNKSFSLIVVIRMLLSVVSLYADVDDFVGK